MRFIADLGSLAPALLVSFAAAALLALGLTPLVRRFSSRFGLVDRPDPRRVNIRPIPRGGGLAVVAAFLPVAILVVILVDRRGIGAISIPSTVGPPELGALLIGGLVAAAIGFLDDALQIRARWQLIGQLAVALMAVALGVLVDGIANPIGPGTIRLDGVFAVAFNPATKKLATGSWDGEVRVWNADDAKGLVTFIAAPGLAQPVATAATAAK